MSALYLDLAVVAILFAATVVHAMLGFGTALVAMPFLAMTVEGRIATPLVALTMLTTITVLVARMWRNVDVRAAWQLLLSSAVGVPFGILVLRYAPEHAFKIGLGTLLIAIGAYNVKTPRLPRLEEDYWVYVFGFVSGALGGAYNINAAPAVICGVTKGWPPERFQATLQGYFLPAAVMISGSHAIAGLWTSEVVNLYLIALPFIFVGAFIGTHISRRLPAAKFERALYVGLLFFGAMLML